MQKFIWYLRQLLPLRYNTKYRTEDGQRWFATWRMWFGRVFFVEQWKVDG